MLDNTLVYLSGGATLYLSKETSKNDREKIKKIAGECGQVGYLSGRKHRTNERVLVFFRGKPTEEEILLRRRHGLLYARWYWIKE